MLSLCKVSVIFRVTLSKITSCLHFSISSSSVESWTLVFLMVLVMTFEYGGCPYLSIVDVLLSAEFAFEFISGKRSEDNPRRYSKLIA